MRGLPEIEAGDDLAELIVPALEGSGRSPGLGDGAVVVIAHKVVSKAEGRVRRLPDVQPGPEAVALAREQDKDPRLVQVVLDESRTVIRASRGVIISQTHHGFVCANAGVDASNVPGEDTVLTLPRDPDASARSLRARLRELTGAVTAVVITDSFGRAWRVGQCDVAIGCAGLAPVEDWRGRPDYAGRELQATLIAVADQLAAVADLARAKDARQPVVVVGGVERHVTAEDGPGAAALIRAQSDDLFR
ncbi:MAG: coenzyme F420-0:L-glutamate ligase [Actinomycetota bacterium]|nr:coenzyme F420-0:L-glutamate ligase [Actinomycetota bacterium]